MLDDYSPKDHKDKSNDILESRIRDVAYRAQDLIEFLISTTLLPHIHLEKRTHDRYYRDLEKVETEVDSVLEELTRIKVESNTVHEDLQPNSCISTEASRVQAPTGKNTMLVFDENLTTTVKAQLCGESSNLEVISIAGMGGLGKTTLAKNVFDDRLIHDRFDRRVWITVSQDYRLKNILLSIVKSLGLNEREFNGVAEEVLRQHLYKYLFGRRYLIVMDDVWDAKFWDDIRRTFPDNSNGSRIMITTRLSNVTAGARRSKFHHQMRFLNEDQSWTLLRENVFVAEEQCPEELEVIGKSIAKNSGGLPLAIVVIAGVLSNVKRTQHDWENIERKVSLTAIDHDDQHLSTIISLSYNHLPHHLKPCFLYLGGYPEDHEIRISKVIRLWVAEGFLKPIESKSLEAAGEEYFKDLVNRNLVLITKKKSNGKFKFCIIHDVLRELCSQRAHKENFLLCMRQKDDFQRVPIENVRRVCNQTFFGDFLIAKYIKKHGSHVRSLINCSSTSDGIEYDSLSIASSSKLLRIWDTNWLCCSNSDEILELLHLRYLNLSVKRRNLKRFSVPSRVFHLQNLQTLIFYSNTSLPSEIWKMSQLRHVMSKRAVVFPPIPYDEVTIIDGVPLLGSLQTLSRVDNFKFTNDIIEMIPNLKKLGWHCNCRNFQVWEDYGFSNLVNLHQLETLYIRFGRFTEGLLPDNFAFPSALTKLTLFNCGIPWKDMSVVGTLPNLQVLILRSGAFCGEEWEPIEGEFLKLKFLNTHFPRLEQLHIRYCDALDAIPLDIGDIPTLQLIKLDLGYYDNPTLESSALEIEQQQRDLGNDDLQVHVVPYWRQTGGAQRMTEKFVVLQALIFIFIFLVLYLI